MRLLLLAFILFLSAPATAQEPQIQTIEFSNAGIYVAGIESKETKANHIGRNTYSNIRLIRRTSVVPATLGTTFGFEYRVKGIPDGGVITVLRKTIYPAPGARPNGVDRRVRSDDDDMTVTLNQTQSYFYTLEEGWEVLPGTWVFEFWLGDRKLGEQRFTLTKK